MKSVRNFWQPWWAQLIAGLLVVLISMLPWLWAWLGKSESSLLPSVSHDASGLLIVFLTSSLLGGWFARVIGLGATGFSVLIDVGISLGFLGLAAQTALSREPKFFSSGPSKELATELWVLLVIFICTQVLYLLITKLSLSVVAMLVAAFGFSVGLWLQALLTYTPLDVKIHSSLTYAGPLVLGLVLGFLGFLRWWYLVVWALSLAIQWVAPALLMALATVLQSPAKTFGKSLDVLGDSTVANMAAMDWKIPLLVTLATAMLTSVVLLIVRKATGRSN